MRGEKNQAYCEDGIGKDPPLRFGSWGRELGREEVRT